MGKGHEPGDHSSAALREAAERCVDGAHRLAERLNALPKRVFSGKRHPVEGARAVFFCFSLPALDAARQAQGIDDAGAWTEEAGTAQWYLYDLANGRILEEAADIAAFIRSEPDTPRYCSLDEKNLSELRALMEKHIKNTYFKRVQAPIGVKATLRAWMELS
mgnify:CR=1 FL=1